MKVIYDQNYKTKTQNTISLNWLIKGFKVLKINKPNLNKMNYLDKKTYIIL